MTQPQQQVDVGAVVRKLQERLSEAITTIAVLEVRLEQLEKDSNTEDVE